MSQAKSKKDREVKLCLSELHALVEKQEERIKAAAQPDTAAEVLADLKELRRPINRIIALQAKAPHEDSKEPASDADSKAVRFERFRQWMLRNAPNCLLGETCQFATDLPEGSGVVALRDLKEDELFLSIPRKMILSTDTALASPLGQFLRNDPLCRKLPSTLLSVFLAYERQNPDSFWTPYLDVLPREFALPLFFSEEELAFLRGSPTELEALKAQRAALRHFSHFQRVLGKAGHLKLPELTVRECLWAIGVVMTRQNRVPGSAQDPSTSVLALIPGWDMCNYAHGKLATFFDIETDTSESRTMAPVKKGDQIYIFYGDRPNSLLFLFSGFVYEGHPDDRLQFPLPPPATDDPLFKLKAMILSKRRLTPDAPGEHFVLPTSGRLPRRMMEYARLFVMDKEEAAFAMKNADAEVLGPRNEAAALTFLKTNIEAALGRYSCSLEEDRRLLEHEQGSLSLNARLAVRMRSLEKAILHRALEFVTRKASDLAAEQPAANA